MNEETRAAVEPDILEALTVALETLREIGYQSKDPDTLRAVFSAVDQIEKLVPLPHD